MAGPLNLVDELHAVTRALRGAGIAYAVCGGIAVTIHGATRSTKDIDLLVAGAEVPRILELVRRLGYLFAQAAAARLAELRALDELTRHLHSASRGGA